MITSLILTLAIISGQLIKLPLSGHSGITLLDTTVLLLCVFGLFRLRFKLKKPPLALTGGLIFIFVAILSLILTPLSLTLPQFISSFLYTIRFSAYILLGWEIYSGAYPLLKNKIHQVLIFSGLSLAILGLLQFIFIPDLRFLSSQGWDPHYYRTASTFLDPNFFGGYMTLTLILLSQKITITNRRNILFFSIVYLALLTTFSRGSYLAFLLSFATLSFLNRSAKLAIITIVLFSGLLLSFYNYQIDIAQPRGIDRARSAEMRLSTWQQGGTIFQNHLLLGVGFNAYRYALEQYNLGDKNFLSSRGSSTNDSSLLFVAATTGIIGLFVFLLFLLPLIFNNKYNHILAAGIAGLIIQSFFANTLFYPFNLIWIILVYSIPKRLSE